jgi:hypothetical protein
MSENTRQQVMVLQYEPALKSSVWKDFLHGCRTRKGLIAMLRREIKCGRFVAFRFIQIQEECFGVPTAKMEVKP